MPIPDPEAEALNHRHRDAESHLSERMGNNHRLKQFNADDLDHSEISENTEIEKDDIEKSATTDSKWHDGLRRDESDKV